MSTPTAPVLSLAICTFNRAASLAHTLESATALCDPGVPWELLVVDNNSTAETSQVCAGFESRLPLRYVREPRQGLSHARNRALRECQGDLLLFTDDDVRLEPGWLVAYVTAFRNFPEAGYFGGRILPLWLSPKPRGFRDESLPLIGGLLMNYDLGNQVRDYAADELLPYGASMALRRTVVQSVGTFRADLGPRGPVPGRGDDDDYLRRTRSAGFEGVYVGDALCRHVVDPVRLKPGYLYRFGVQKGIAAVLTGDKTTGRGSYGTAAIHMLRALGQAVRGRGDRWRQCMINAGIQAGIRGERGR